MKKWLKDIPLGRVPTAALQAFLAMIVHELKQRQDIASEGQQ